MSLLVRRERPDHEDLQRLRAHVSELERVLGERDAQLVKVRAELDVFKAR